MALLKGCPLLRDLDLTGGCELDIEVEDQFAGNQMSLVNDRCAHATHSLLLHVAFLQALPACLIRYLE